MGCTITDPFLDPLAPMSSINSVIGGLSIPDGNRCVPIMNGNLATAVLSPRGVYVLGNKRKKTNKQKTVTFFMFTLPILIRVF